MPANILMPKLGVEMVTGKVVEWKKEEGEWINQGEILLVIETEKISYEMESPASGYVHLVTPLNVSFPIGELMAVVVESQEELGKLAVTAAGDERALSTFATTAHTPVVGRKDKEESRKVRISAVARKMAEERGADLATIRGTGPQGRITREDVLQALKEAKPAAPPAEGIKPPTPVAFKTVKETIPLKGIRKAMADHMFRSLQTTAQMTLINEVDMTETTRFREEVNSQLEGSGIRISFPDIFVKIVAALLKDEPLKLINSSLDGEEIKIWEEINIGVAVAVGGGLIVPVVHQADKKSLLEIHEIVTELVEKARNNRLMPDDVAGGTFTVNSIGSFGIEAITAVINLPQAAMLSLGRIVKKPSVVGDEITIRSIMSCSLTVDHRILDGAIGGNFLQGFEQIVNNHFLIATM